MGLNIFAISLFFVMTHPLLISVQGGVVKGFGLVSSREGVVVDVISSCIW